MRDKQPDAVVEVTTAASTVAPATEEENAPTIKEQLAEVAAIAAEEAAADAPLSTDLSAAETVPDAASAVAEAVAEKKDPTNLKAQIAELRATLGALQTKGRVKSGSKPRPNVQYVILDKPPAWSKTPQVAQLQAAIFDPTFIAAHRKEAGTVVVSEPDLFAHLKEAAAAGIIRTTQEPVRIFQYYRSTLIGANALRMV